MNDIWKDVPNWEGIYQVSNLGNVKSLARQKSNRFEEDRILKPRITQYGYLYVGLSNNGVKNICLFIDWLLLLLYQIQIILNT